MNAASCYRKGKVRTLQKPKTWRYRTSKVSLLLNNANSRPLWYCGGNRPSNL